MKPEIFMNKNNKNNEKVDLRGASKDPDTGGIKFHEHQASRSHYSKKTPKIIQWTIKYSGGLVKNKKQAIYVLMGFVILAVIVSLFLVFSECEQSQRETEYNPDTKYQGKDLSDDVR